MTFILTDEQTAIRDAYLTRDDLVIEAGAGTGKTTTLRGLAQADDRRGIYVAYNRATADDADRSFPWSVRCSTAHSLAYQAVGRRYRRRLRDSARQPAKVTAGILAELNPAAFGIGLDAGIHRAGLARLTLRTLDGWCRSADDQVLPVHVPDTPQLTPTEREGAAAAAVLLASTAWQDLQHDDEHGGGRLPFEHNHYLKAWALTRPRLPADVIMFDEAQDANPVMAAIIEAQTHAQRVAVGDSSQAINGWNGAIDAMAGWSDWRRLPLSHSFRFGPAVADMANLWLDALAAPLRLAGAEHLDTRIGYVAEPQAVLCRGNVSALVAADREVNDGRRVAMVGGTADVKRLAYAAKDLQGGRPTDHPQLYLFDDWDDLRDYAEHDGADLNTFVKLIDRFGPAWVLRLAADLDAERDAEVVTSTVHKAKGREWPNVLIGPDFPQPGDEKPDGSPAEFTREDAMLAYVAVTRARELLDPGSLAWIEHTAPEFTDGTQAGVAA